MKTKFLFTMRWLTISSIFNNCWCKKKKSRSRRHSKFFHSIWERNIEVRSWNKHCERKGEFGWHQSLSTWSMLEMENRISALHLRILAHGNHFAVLVMVCWWHKNLSQRQRSGGQIGQVGNQRAWWQWNCNDQHFKKKGLPSSENDFGSNESQLCACPQILLKRDLLVVQKITCIEIVAALLLLLLLLLAVYLEVETSRTPLL